MQTITQKTVEVFRSLLEEEHTHDTGLSLRRGYLLLRNCADMEVLSYNAGENIGIARFHRTGYRVAFRLLATPATPRACRDHQPEYRVCTFEIDTVAEDGGIQAAIGEQHGTGVTPQVLFNI